MQILPGFEQRCARINTSGRFCNRNRKFPLEAYPVMSSHARYCHRQAPSTERQDNSSLLSAIWQAAANLRKCRSTRATYLSPHFDCHAPVIPWPRARQPCRRCAIRTTWVRLGNDHIQSKPESEWGHERRCGGHPMSAWPPIPDHWPRSATCHKSEVKAWQGCLATLKVGTRTAYAAACPKLRDRARLRTTPPLDDEPVTWTPGRTPCSLA